MSTKDCGCGGTCERCRTRSTRTTDRTSGFLRPKDRQGPNVIDFYADKIGKSMAITPEGFLICRNVPIARTGEQIYGPKEVAVPAGTDGVVRVERPEDEVFSPEAIASFEGKDVVDEHPHDGVTPDNWRDVTVGHVQNVHRGTGVEDDFLFADLIIKDPDAIEAIRAGKREISCGYDSEYEQTGPGRARQYNIRGNHVALVERGRCGPRCAIHDHRGVTVMKTGKSTMKDRLMKVLGVKDAEELEEVLKQPAPGEVDAAGESATGGHHIEIHNHMPESAAAGGEGGGEGAGELDQEELPPWFTQHVAANNQRFDKVEGMLAELLGGQGGEGEGAGAGEGEGEGEGELDHGRRRDAAEAEKEKEFEDDLEQEIPEGAAKDKAKSKDSALLTAVFQDTMSIAEIIAPGITLPEFNPKAPIKTTYDAICATRRQALDRAKNTEDTKALVEDVIAGADLTKMKGTALRTAFRAVGAARKRIGDAGRKANDGSLPGAGGGLGIAANRQVKSLAELNKLNKDLWSGRKTA